MLHLLGSDLIAQSTESQDARNNKTSKTFHKHSWKDSRLIQHTWRIFKLRPRTRSRGIYPAISGTNLPNKFMPYIEGPKMDWTVNDCLYHRLLIWHLKCENILECELAMLPEKRQCKKVIAWSGDFGMGQYVSWSLSTDELMLDTIWKKNWGILQTPIKWSQG